MRYIREGNIRTADCGQWERKEFAGCQQFALGHTMDVLPFLRMPGKLTCTGDVTDDTGCALF